VPLPMNCKMKVIMSGNVFAKPRRVQQIATSLLITNGIMMIRIIVVQALACQEILIDLKYSISSQAVHMSGRWFIATTVLGRYLNPSSCRRITNGMVSPSDPVEPTIVQRVKSTQMPTCSSSDFSMQRS
jgi:hypothetical protein